MSSEPVALVTGAAQGTGAAIARRLAADGYRVVIFDVQEGAARRVADDLSERYATSRSYALDVCDRNAVQAAVAAAMAEFGRLCVLVNNAAVISLREFDQISDNEWHRMIDTNLRAPFLLTQAALPHLLREQRSRVINIASNLAKHAYPLYAHYCAAKAGLVGMTQALAVEYAGTGLTANSVCPAITSTPMMEQVVAEIHERQPLVPVAEIRKSLCDDIPLGRPTEPSEVASVVSFLASAESDFITAQAINVNGGQLRL